MYCNFNYCHKQPTKIRKYLTITKLIFDKTNTQKHPVKLYPSAIQALVFLL